MSHKKPTECEIMAACYRIMAVLQTFSDKPQVFTPDTCVDFGKPPLNLTQFRAFMFRSEIEEEFGLPDTGAFSVPAATIRELAIVCLQKRRG